MSDSERQKTTPRIRGTTPELQDAARLLRRRTTPAEQLLWDAIKGKRLAGLRFRQQHPVGPFVLDFYCPSHKLVIELDGGIHRDQADQDEYRDRHLATYGYTVMRFPNEAVFRDLPVVLAEIVAAAERIRAVGPPSPPILGGDEGRDVARPLQPLKS